MALNLKKYYDTTETILPKERHQNLETRLQKTIARAYRSAPAIRAMMTKAGIKPSDVKNYTDLQKIPITRKSDIIEMQRTNPPYGGFLTIVPVNIERIFISPGPIYEPLHSSRIKWFARAFWAAGFRKGDIVINTFTYHLSPAGMLFHEALRHCGATVVVTGAGNTEIQVQTIRDLKVTGFVGTPSFLMTIIQKTNEMGLNFAKDCHLHKAWFTGEMLSTSLRETLENDYQVNTFQAYAVTEPGGCIAYECEQKAGLHMMDDYVVEIVDPLTGKQLKAGSIGEIVVTPLLNNAWGLVRFGTGDLSSYTTEPCRCGRTAHKLTRILGRTGDAVKVRGMFLIARQAEEALSHFGMIERFQLVVTREGPRDNLTLKAELKQPKMPSEDLLTRINAKFQSVCRVKIDKFIILAAGTINDPFQKIIDQRKWD